ncbi:hypothetical protein HMPREF9078_01592 [Capnocytophaga sp. oral taxon 380 str. F0488]|nr:hypothetical protein HMPREF9078_01592 [Capnocytophaga sp. oral taxon 380 str. F0488]
MNAEVLFLKKEICKTENRAPFTRNPVFIFNKAKNLYLYL